MTTVAIIPARLASSRFPRKVLADRTGKPLIQHVYESARRCTRLDEVVVATDAAEVADVVMRFGARAVMTAVEHPNGTSRLAEAARSLGLAGDDIVVNVQGDEPEVEPGPIAAAIDALVSSGAPSATVASPFAAGENPSDPNIVKVVRSAAGLALYFSRAAIPFARAGGTGEQAALKHVGLYAYRRAFLDLYVTLAPTPLERTEVLEQLRVLEHGHAMAVAVHPVRSTGIDTPEQYEAFVKRVGGPTR